MQRSAYCGAKIVAFVVALAALSLTKVGEPLYRSRKSIVHSLRNPFLNILLEMEKGQSSFDGVLRYIFKPHGDGYHAIVVG